LCSTFSVQSTISAALNAKAEVIQLSARQDNLSYLPEPWNFKLLAVAANWVEFWTKRSKNVCCPAK
jgi:hypothetical protein